MTLRTNGFEGQTNGDTPTQANSGTSGTAFSVAVTTTGSPIADYSSAQSAHGSRSMHINCAASSNFYPRYSSYSATSVAHRVYFRFAAIPTTAGDYFQIRDTASAVVGGFGMNTTGQPLIKSNAGGTILATWAALTANTWYRLEMEYTRGSGTTDGVVNARMYLFDDTTPISGMTFSTTTANLGTVNLGAFLFGKITTANASELYIDDVAVNDGTSTPIGPVATNVAPTANAGATQIVEREAVVTLNGTDADSDGTIASRQWTVASFPAGSTSPTLTGATTASATFTAAAAGVYTLQYVVTDNGGLTSTPSTVSIYVYPHSTEDVTVRSVTLGSWTQYGSASTVVAGLNDTLATTGILSPVNPTVGQTALLQMNPYGPGDIKLYVESQYVDAAVNRTVTFLKEDGVTSFYTTSLTPTASSNEVVISVDSAGLAAVPSTNDRKAFFVRFGSAVA